MCEYVCECAHAYTLTHGEPFRWRYGCFNHLINILVFTINKIPKYSITAAIQSSNFQYINMLVNPLFMSNIYLDEQLNCDLFG